jgi:hypothetical protein
VIPAQVQNSSPYNTCGTGKKEWMRTSGNTRLARAEKFRRTNPTAGFTRFF